MQWIRINGKEYTLEDLLSTQLSLSGPHSESQSSDKDDFVRSTLEFCHEWLSGAGRFTLHTSGSTGAPKEIILRREQLEQSARGTAKALGLKDDFVALLCLDTKYIAGKMMLVRSFITGMNVIAVSPIANPFSGLSSTDKIDFAAVVPYQLMTILDSPDDLVKLNALKVLIVGGAELSQKTKARVVTLRSAVYATYGMTETISHVALQKLNPPGEQAYFELLDNVSIDTDERGCLVVSADYLGNDKIITNDLVELMSPKKFRWLGRWDNVINSGGVKIIPEIVEKVIEKIFSSLRLTNRFFIAGEPDEHLGSRVVLVVEGIFPTALQETILKKIQSALPKYESPKSIRVVDKFLETETGKVLRAMRYEL